MRSGKAPNRAIEIEALARLFEGDIPQNGWDRPYTGVRTDRYTYVVWTETGEERALRPQARPERADTTSPPIPPTRRSASASPASCSKLRNCKGASCDVKP